MAKVDGDILTAGVSEVRMSGRLNDEGKIDTLLICGLQHLILTLVPADAKRLADGLLSAVADAKRAKK